MHAWKIMLTRNWNTGGYLDLFFDQIVIDHFFSHRMFYLDAGVHFHEIEFLVFVNQEFNGSGAFVIHRPCSCDSGFPHFFPEFRGHKGGGRSEEHTSELQSLMRISYAVFCLKQKKENDNNYQATYATIHYITHHY